MKHIAYVFDALVYYMRSGIDDLKGPCTSEHGAASVGASGAFGGLDIAFDENENDDQEAMGSPAGAISQQDQQQMDLDLDDDSSKMEVRRGRKHGFFTRSESTLCLGCPPPDPFATPMSEALPLAEQPQLLQPNARREDMFGAPKQPLNHGNQADASLLSVLPTRLGLSVERESSRAYDSNAGAPSGSMELSTAPFQGGPRSEANFERIVAGHQRAASPAAATCDTASVRSSNVEEMDNEPQDLSMSAASSVSGADEAPLAAASASTSTASATTKMSPKKSLLLREREWSRYLHCTALYFPLIHFDIFLG